jgi:hypothetical protein
VSDLRYIPAGLVWLPHTYCVVHVGGVPMGQLLAPVVLPR